VVVGGPRLGLRGFFGGFPEGLDAEDVFFFLAILYRARAGAEYAFDQLEVAMADKASAEAEGDSGAALDANVRMFVYEHAFIVEANLFFDTLEELGPHFLPGPEVKEARRIYRSRAEEVGRLRDHVEHLPERIRKGRKGRRHGPPMEPEVFREAVGKFVEGTKLLYGDERYDLRAIRDEIRRVEERTAPRLEERLKPKLRGFAQSSGSPHAGRADMRPGRAASPRRVPAGQPRRCNRLSAAASIGFSSAGSLRASAGFLWTRDRARPLRPEPARAYFAASTAPGAWRCRESSSAPPLAASTSRLRACC
jgi:hypothetical protein